MSSSSGSWTLRRTSSSPTAASQQESDMWKRSSVAACHTGVALRCEALRSRENDVGNDVFSLELGSTTSQKMTSRSLSTMSSSENLQHCMACITKQFLIITHRKWTCRSKQRFGRVKRIKATLPNPFWHAPRILLLQNVVEAIQMRVWPCSELRWPVDEQVSALSLADKSGTNSPIAEG